ncbi:MAG TPA: sigma-70 family RNA polymerase sigma factor [Polyangia bacterium]|nr:sigma-70 family RNA polymerase sigma factor [Polyangia bacterium]
MTLRSVDRGAGTEEASRPVDFDAVYQEHVQTVARWAARLGGPGADIEDLTQEVFLLVNRRLADFRHESRLSTWLFSITAKIVANDRRRRRIRRWWTRFAPHAVERAVATADTPLEELERRERRTEFYRALDALNERQRRVLVLFELEEMSVAEIAALLGLRPGNVRVLLHRARAAFLRRMTERELRATLAREEPGSTEQQT